MMFGSLGSGARQPLSPPPPINVVRKLIVGDDAIELRRRLVVPGGPSLSVVKADGRSLVCAENQPRRICRINPKLVVVVASRCTTQDRNRLASVVRAV